MKSILVFTVLAALISACNPPRTKRAVYNGRSLDDETSTTPANLNNQNNPRSEVGEETFDRDTKKSNGLTIPDEISDCSWSEDGVTGYSTTSSHLGAHTICQSKTNSDDIYVQVKNGSSDDVCFIPTYAENNKSIYIGNPRCLKLEDPNKIYKVTVYRNRNGYSQFTTNGVMVMKDKMYFYSSPFNQWVLAPDAYIFCSQFLDQYGDGRYCDSFKNKGEYIYKKF